MCVCECVYACLYMCCVYVCVMHMCAVHVCACVFVCDSMC